MAALIHQHKSADLISVCAGRQDKVPILLKPEIKGCLSGAAGNYWRSAKLIANGGLPFRGL